MFLPGNRRNTRPNALTTPRTNFTVASIVVMTIELRRNNPNGTDSVASV